MNKEAILQCPRLCGGGTFADSKGGRMPVIVKYILAVVLGYFWGNLQFAVIFSRIIHNDDVRRHGSSNAGATNMFRVYGVGEGVLTFVGDLVKGAAGYGVGYALGGENMAYTVVLSLIIGHCYPVLFSFKGGKGAAAMLGSVWIANPIWAIVVTVSSIVTVLITGIVSAATLVGITLFMFMALIWGEGVYIKLVVAAIWLLMIWRHRDNIRRMLNGTESKVGKSK